MTRSSTKPPSRAAPHPRRAAELLESEHRAIIARTDRMFALVMLLQWLAAITLVPWVCPPGGRIWTIALATAITSAPIILALLCPGRRATRHVLAIAQALWAGLLIHVTGGRIETHFLVFGSLALLAFYRDVKVLILASAVVVLDHLVRGIWWPESIYGVADPGWWRLLEHTGWIAFIDLFLIRNSRDGYSDLAHRCQRQAELEASREALSRATSELEDRVVERTRELDASRRELFQFLDSIPMAVLVVDPDGRPVFASRQTEAFAGGPITEPLELDNITEAYNIYYRGSDRYYRNDALPLNRALRGESAFADDLDVLLGGIRIPLAARAAPIFAPGGELAYALCTFEDITEQVRAESERLQVSKLESVGRLAAGIAHEINTPMQYIGDNAAFLETALDELLRVIEAPGCPDAADRIDRIAPLLAPGIASIREGVETVCTLLSSMRTFSHPGSTDRVPVDLNAAVKTTTTVSRNEWRYVANLVADLDPALPAVPGLPGELNQVLLNLVVNAAHAIEATGERGTIRVVTTREGDHAVIRISDTGTGIPPEIRDSIFDPFFTTKVVGRGTGQGLAITRSIVVGKHGGTIEVDSEGGRGTTFTVRLPLSIE